MKHAQLCILSGSLLLAAAGCHDDTNATSGTATTNTPTMTAGTGIAPTPAATNTATPPTGAMNGEGTATDAGVTLTDAQVLQVAHFANSGEVAQANFALGVTKDARVKAFAQMMASDHSDADAKGASVAKKEGLTLADSPLSAKVQADGDKTMADLKPRTGADFDKAYVDAQLKGHQDVLSAIDDKLMPSAKDVEVKAYLMAIRPKVAEHLKHAQQLQSDLLKKPS